MDKLKIRVNLKKGDFEAYLPGREGDEDYYLSNGEEATYIMINGTAYPVMWRLAR